MRAPANSYRPAAQSYRPTNTNFGNFRPAGGYNTGYRPQFGGW